VKRRHSHLPAQSALSSAFMVNNAFEKTRIWLGSRCNDYRSLNFNMMLKNSVLENTRGSWTYKGHQEISY
jgi:hypothetical protein